MASLSVKQKALIFLNRFKTLDSSNIYNTPWEITQDGVANALCISRAHASIILNQLKDEGNVEEKITHVKNGKVKRKSYFLTPAGMEQASKVMEIVTKENIDVTSILDAGKRDPTAVLEKLNEKERYAMGCACAFCMPVSPRDLPPLGELSLPTNIDGEVFVEADIRDKILESASEEEKAEWHGFAANYWLNRKIKMSDDLYICLHELLFHYIESGRNRDSCKLISTDYYYFLYSIDDQIHDSVKKVRVVDRYAKDVLSLKIAVCIEYGEMDEAKELIGQLRAIDKECASVFAFDMEMKNGNRAAAEAAIAETWQTYPLAGIRKAVLLRLDGKYPEARYLLDSIKGIVGSELDSFQVEKYIELAMIDAAEGHPDDAYMRLSKVKATFNNGALNKRLDALERQFRAQMRI